MKNENKATKRKNKIWKKAILILLIVLVVISLIVGGYFLYKYLFPTDKELFFISHEKTFFSDKTTDEPDAFLKTSEITIKTEGDFTSEKAAEAFSSIVISTENVKLSEEETEYDLSINFLGNDFITTKAVKSGDTEVFSFPQLSEKSYGADSYEDVMTVLFGSEDIESVEMLDGTDTEQLEIYSAKYIKKLRDNIPDKDFSSRKEGDIKVITLKTDLNRALYDIANEIKSDTDLREFLYEQTVIVENNINKKFAYLGSLVDIPKQDEYYKNYEKSIDDFIKNIENSEIIITVNVDKNRKILAEELKVINDDKVQYAWSYSADGYSYESYKDEKLLLKIDSKTKTDGTKIEVQKRYKFDINDYTKEKSDEQKMVTLNISSTTDTNVTREIILPQDYDDIRSMSEEEKQEITENASKNFFNLLATFTMELLS